MRNILFQAFRIFFIGIACTLFISSPQAQTNNDVHIQSAFLFADQKNWQEAGLHARASGNKELQKFIQWLRFQDTESGADFQEITDFVKENPNWPQINRLKLRAEQAIRLSNTEDKTLTKWFAENPPISGIGKIAYAEAQLRAGSAIGNVISYIRQGWIDGDFDETEEKRISNIFGKYLRTEEHIARTDRLLWESKTQSAERMLPYLSADQKTLANARIALIQGKKTAPLYVLKVPRSLHNNPGLLFNRMLWRAKRDDDSGVREVLREAPSTVPYPEKWWRYREAQVRKSIDERKFNEARALLKNHGQKEGSEYADALWLKGWVELQFFGNAQDAYKQFYTMFDTVKFPVSKARAAYWAARAAKKIGDKDAEQSWYNSASAYPSTFYGQLASAALHNTAPLNIPADPIASKETYQQFHDKELVKIIKLCISYGRDDMATQLVNHLIDQANTPHEMALAVAMVKDLQSTMLGVRAAKRALQKNTLLMEAGYPIPAMGNNLSVEMPLAYAITRQESEFDAQVRSSAGAIGYMQLMPATAKEVARKADIAYAPARLTEPYYNTQLGSMYLRRLIDAYNGSYVQAIAAYNAGPGRVREWVGEFGDPGTSTESVIDWIEKIPFLETRNYVQRVLENLQIYRYLLSTEDAPALRIEEDLLRGR